MNVQCTHCSTVFRVDPRKIPAAGVRVRCSICRGVFELSASGDAEPQPSHAAAAPQPASAPAEAPAPAEATVPIPTPAPAGAPRANPFGASDPGAKAKRLARALVSDIVTYHPERRDQALANGTLKREFMEEIEKSWEEYVGQVGNETAKNTPHFRDALNQILAKGQAVF